VVTQIARFFSGKCLFAKGFGAATRVLSCPTLVARQALQLRHIDPVQDHRQLAGPQFQSLPRTLGARQLEYALLQPLVPQSRMQMFLSLRRVLCG
jgi:hypothetical protein